MIAAQKNYSIVYEQSSLTANDVSTSKLEYWKVWLIINDSVSYTKSWHDAKDTAMDIVGNKFVLHSTFRNYATKKEVSQGQPRDNPKLKIIDSIKYKGWWLLDTSEVKIILGFTCRKARLENTQGHIITAWYSTALPKCHSPTMDDCLPGTILEITDYYTKFTMIATCISQRYIQVIEPKGGKQVRRDNYQERVRKLYE